MTHRDGTKVQAKNGMGWLHRIRKGNGGKSEYRKPVEDTKLTATECRTMQADFKSALSPDKLRELMGLLALPEKSLRAFGVGYRVDTRLWTFPMFDGQRRICGFRTRDRDGNKRSLLGSRNGIFIPSDYDEPGQGLLDVLDDKPLVLLLPEGPTDAAAAHSIGYCAVGRPSNMGGGEQIKALLESEDRKDVIIIADRDKTKRSPVDGTPFNPGIEGAMHLAQMILSACGTLKIVLPPGNVKDLRKWIIEGGEQVIFEALSRDAELITARVLKDKYAKLDAWKQLGRVDFRKRQEAQAAQGQAVEVQQ
jgi:hypothetical protein